MNKESWLFAWLFAAMIVFLGALIIGSYAHEIRETIMYVLLVAELSSIASMFFIWRYNKKHNGQS